MWNFLRIYCEGVVCRSGLRSMVGRLMRMYQEPGGFSNGQSSEASQVNDRGRRSPVELPRVAILTNIPAPYRIEQFNRLCVSRRFSYKVYFCARTESNRSWDSNQAEREMLFEHEYLRSKRLRPLGKHSYLALGFLSCLLRERPEAVVVGG